jgi:hypothetical protein
MDKQSQIEALNRETEKHKKKESERLIIDFDEAIKEQKAETIQVKFDGDLYEIPATPPAWLPIFINRHNQKGVLDDEANLEVIERLLGEELALKILNGSNFISFSLINDKILSPVFEHWGMAFNDESGKAQSPSS